MKINSHQIAPVLRILAVIIGVLSIAPAVYAADFSADMVSSSPQGSMKAKIYVSGEKSRFEMPGAVSINRMDKKVIWMLMLREKMYMEQPLDPQTAMSTQEKLDGEIERTVIGKEAVSGINATKYRVTYETVGRRDAVFQWIDDANKFPVKTAALDGSWWSEFRNIRTSPQDPALFEIPAGYKKFAIPTMNDIKARAAQYGGETE